MTMNDELESLIERSCELHEAIHAHAGALEPYPELRYELARDSGLLSLEHGSGFLLLVSQELHNAAFALLRPQFEALVRGFWLAYAASDAWVEKFAQPLTHATAHTADDAPMLAEMLKRLKASDWSQKQVVAQLEGYRDVTWKALNSFNHGGLHPLSKFVTGYSPRLTYDSLRNSNAVSTLGLQLVTVMSGDPADMGEVRRIHVDYADCLPILKS